MSISLTSWPKRHSRLGAPLYLTPRVKYKRFASIAEADPADSPNYRNIAIQLFPS